jgi:soluble lytic murein transglycosylase-like protein
VLRLTHRTGSLAGTTAEFNRRLIRIGRGSVCDLKFEDDESGNISLLHAAIVFEEDSYWIVDAGSQFGTTVNGTRVKRQPLRTGDLIRFGGDDGPEMSVAIESTIAPEAGPAEALPVSSSGFYDAKRDAADMARVLRSGTMELSSARILTLAAQRVADARAAQGGGSSRQTMEIMAETFRDVSQVVRLKSRKKWVRITSVVGVGLFVALIVIFFQQRKIRELLDAKGRYDQQIAQIQDQMQTEQDSVKLEELGKRLDDATRNAELTLAAIGKADKAKAQQLEQSGDSLDKDIRTILAEFSASTYAVPPIFKERLAFYIGEMVRSGPTLKTIYHRKQRYWPMISKQFARLGLPEEMAYVAWEESKFDPEARSSAGAVGLWQMTSETARRLGLRVDASVDERLDPVKQTPAAAHHLANLLAEFGEDAFMLVMASYNRGEEGVRRALRQVAQEQGGFRKEKRDFWHLYALKKLPPETREYVPKILAAAIICRHPERYGLEPDSTRGKDSVVAVR